MLPQVTKLTGASNAGAMARSAIYKPGQRPSRNPKYHAIQTKMERNSQSKITRAVRINCRDFWSTYYQFDPNMEDKLDMFCDGAMWRGIIFKKLKEFPRSADPVEIPMMGGGEKKVLLENFQLLEEGKTLAVFPGPPKEDGSPSVVKDRFLIAWSYPDAERYLASKQGGNRLST